MLLSKITSSTAKSSPSSPSTAASGSDLAGQLQTAQSVIGRAQRSYGDSDIRFWALGLAWEAVRLAWYEVVEGHNGGKLRNVENALNDYKRMVEARR